MIDIISYDRQLNIEVTNQKRQNSKQTAVQISVSLKFDMQPVFIMK